MTQSGRLARWGVASLLVHGLAWLALLFAPGLVGRTLEEPPTEPAIVEVVLGEGGETIRPEHGEDASPAPEAASQPPTEAPTEPPPEPQAEPPVEPLPAPKRAPPPEPAAEVKAEPAPPPEPPQEAAPPPPPAPSPPPPEPPPLPPPPEPPRAQAPAVAAPPPRPPVVPSARAVPPPSAGGAAAVRLGDAGKPPHADLLDPENNRFRAATQDNGNRMPAYPREAALRFEAGTVKLQLLVDTTGKVVNALVVKSAGSAALDTAARDQALTWRFTPARRDGRAVQDIVEIEIEFKLL